MNDNCTVCGLPTHADADSGQDLCVRCYWWLDENEREKFERWVDEQEKEERP